MDILKLNEKKLAGGTSVVIVEKNNKKKRKTVEVNQAKQLIEVKESEQSIILYKEQLKEKQFKNFLTNNIENILLTTSVLDYPHPQPMLEFEN